jgi:hypothetical protein
MGQLVATPINSRVDAEEEINIQSVFGRLGPKRMKTRSDVAFKLAPDVEEFLRATACVKDENQVFRNTRLAARLKAVPKLRSAKAISKR